MWKTDADVTSFTWPFCSPKVWKTSRKKSCRYSSISVACLCLVTRCSDYDVIKSGIHSVNLHRAYSRMHSRPADEVHYTLTKPDDPWKHCKLYLKLQRCLQNEAQRKADVYTGNGISLYLCSNIITLHYYLYNLSTWVCICVNVVMVEVM